MSEPITIRQILKVAWSEWRLLVFTTVVGLVLAVCLLQITRPQYVATMVVSPANDSSSVSGLNSQFSQFSSIASLAGIRLPDSEVVTPFAKFNELLNSVVLADKLEQKYHFLRQIYWRRWDEKNQSWLPPAGIVYGLKKVVYGILNRPFPHDPDAFDLQRFIALNLSDNTVELSSGIVSKTGMKRLSFSYYDPDLALRMLEAIYSESDNLIREDAKIHATKQIEYLESQLQRVTIAEQRNVLTQLLLSQEQQRMLASSGTAFSANMVEPPIVSDRPRSSNAVIAILVGLLLGAGSGLVIGLVRRRYFGATGPTRIWDIRDSIRNSRKLTAASNK